VATGGLAAVRRTVLGETLVRLWTGEHAADLVHADKDRLNLLSLDRSMRTLPEWHFRNREKARWLRRSWMFLTVGIVLIAVAAVLVLARTLNVTPPEDHGPANDLTWGWIGAMIGVSALLAGIAVSFDWLGAGRAVDPRNENEREAERLESAELGRIAEMLRKSPLATGYDREEGSGSPVPADCDASHRRKG
jgi:hypothetical protein